MRYLFRILCFGEPVGVIRFLQQAGDTKFDEIASTEDLQVFDKEITIENNTCNLELCAILKDSADFDEIIPTTDGILYFLDPSNDIELQTFYLIMDILEKLDRNIPTCLILHSREQYFNVPVNRFAQEIWEKHDYVEIFSYGPLSSKKRDEPIITLAEAMISSSVPINYDLVWMRLPIFIKKTNTLVKKGKYERAGINAECVARIAKKFKENNYFIYAEQSAFLFQQVKAFLKAQHVLADVDPKMAEFFRKAYVQSMVRDADGLFKQRIFAGAAQKYEASANWAKMELNDDQLATEIYGKAIETWVSACEVQNSFRLLTQISHENKQKILSKIAPRIAQAADFLMSIQKVNHAKAQLYACIDIYQKEGLFEDLKIITRKILDVLKTTLNQALNAKDAHLAKLSFDEFENIVDTFEVQDPPNIGVETVTLAEAFVNVAEFSKVDEIIPKVTDAEEQKRITQLKIKKEEALHQARKDSQSNLEVEAANRIKSFYLEEIKGIEEENQQVLQQVQSLESRKDFHGALQALQARTDWLFFAKYIELASKICADLLVFFLKMDMQSQFLLYVFKLPDSKQKTFLNTNVPTIIESVRRVYGKQGIDAARQFCENLNRVYRHLELFEQASSYAVQLVAFYIEEANRVINQADARQAIAAAQDCLKRAQEIQDGLLDGTKIRNDPVYEKIANLYISLGDLAQAEAAMQKIDDKSIYTEIHKKIQDIEAKKTEAVTAEVKEKFVAEFTQAQINMLRSHAREAAMSKREDFRKRVGLKRRMFQDGLDGIRNKAWDNAIGSYLKASETFMIRKMMSEAGLTLAVAGLIDLNRKNVDGVRSTISSSLEKAGVSKQILEETFPVKIMKFVLDMSKYEQDALAKQALTLLDNLPFFREELDILGNLAGTKFTSLEDGTEREHAEVVRPEISSSRGSVAPTAVKPPRERPEFEARPEKAKIDAANIQMELEHEIGTLRLLSREARNASVDLMRKRTALRRAFYKEALEGLAKKNFALAAKGYEETANSFMKRRDFPPLGLAIALHSLCLIQSDLPPDQVEDRLAAMLKGLGPNETVVRETFPIKVVLFLLKAKRVENKDQLKTGWSLLDNLPLFDEEKGLIARPRNF